MKTIKEKITEMLKENTGTHMLDSGSAYGRSWEKNQSKDFEKDTSSCEFDEHGVTIKIWNFLVELLDITEKSETLQKEYQDFIKDREDTYHLQDMEDFLDKLKTDDRLETDDYIITQNPKVENTYNYDNLLSQGLQYAVFQVDGTEYIILQIHNGCDTRGGYTTPYIFECDVEEFVLNITTINVSTKDGKSYYSDDCGYHFYDNDSNDETNYNDLFKKGIEGVWF